MKTYIISISIFLATSSLFAQDWANFQKYEDANKEILMSTTGTKTVLLGNSITEGWPNSDPDFFTENELVGRGIGGQVTSQMLLRFRKDVIELSPERVVILAGINDIANNQGPITLENIADNIFSMAELARANHIDVILCSVLPANKFPWRPEINPTEKVKLLNQMILEYANKNNLTYIDYYSAMVDDNSGLKEELGNDAVHPNLDGYKIMEGLLMKALDKQ